MTQAMTQSVQSVEKSQNIQFSFQWPGISLEEGSILAGSLFLNCTLGQFLLDKYNFMIRKTTYFSKERDSMLELVKKSTQSTDSRGETDEPKLRFFQFFLERTTAQPITCKITRVQTVPKMASQRRYAVYCISVRTDVVQYYIKKRYTQFERLYQRCSKLEKMGAAFPPRTIFQAGWSAEVTSYRMAQLNKFLEEISKNDVSDAVKIELYDFIHLYEQYQAERMESLEKEDQVATDEFLLQEMERLNDNSSKILDSLDKIKLSISDRKKRLAFEVARNLLMGFDSNSGILSIALSNSNYLVVLRGLELLNWLISPEAHRDYQIFRRMLTKCLPNQLVIQEYSQFRTNGELRAEYFKLIKQYLSARQDGNIQIIAKFYDFGQEMQSEYQRWVKFTNLDSRG